MDQTTQPCSDAPVGQIGRALAVLEAVAQEHGAGAREIARRTGIPLPSVYRIVHELMGAGYLVHLREEQRFALGYSLHRLAVGLHQDLGIPRAVREELRALHVDLGCATYLAIHRGSDFVVVDVVDSPSAPRLEPMGFGFHESPHATAFGKVALSALPSDACERVLGVDPLRAHTSETITDPVRLHEQLHEVRERGIAWEHEEFQPGIDCLAAPITAGDGMLIGSVAISAPSRSFDGRRLHVEDRIRACAARAGRAFRLGSRNA